MTTAQASALRQELVNIAQPHKCLTEPQEATAARLCEAGKSFLLKKAKALVVSAQNRPLLYSYSADGTPIRSTKRVVVPGIPGQKPVVRMGGEQNEFLIERGFIITRNAVGDLTSTAMMTDAAILSDGKGAWNIYTSATKFFPHLREVGHRHIAITHGCFDRALHSALAAKLAKRQRAYYNLKYGPGPWSGEATMQELMDWYVQTACSAHDCHNALKWGMMFASTDLVADLKSLWVMLASLRNSYSQVFSFLNPFVRERLQFSDEMCKSEAELLQMWQDLGMRETVAGDLAALGLTWRDGSYFVRAQFDGSEGLQERVIRAIVSVLRFRKFTDSRWLTVGESCRRLITGQLLGLSALVDVIRRTPHASDWYIHGYWDNNSANIRRFAAIAALASGPIDAALLLILEDHRLAGKYRTIDEELQKHYRWLTRVQDSTWSLVAASIGSDDVSAESIRSDCLMAATAAAGFLYDRCLRHLLDYPWCLCEGNISENLDQLAAKELLPAGTDDTTVKIWKLARRGIDRQDMVNAVSLLAEVPWSTLGVEQGHASASILKRQHPMMSTEMICRRAFVHSFKPLVQQPDVDRHEHIVARIQSSIARLEATSGRGRTGRNLFLGEFTSGAMTFRIGAPPSARKDTAQWAMRHHGAMWSELSADDKAWYERQAEERNLLLQEKTNKDIAELRQKLIAARGKLNAAARGEGLPLTCLAANRLSPQDLNTLAAIYHSDEFGTHAVQRLRAASTKAPAQPGPAHMKTLNDVKVLLARPTPKCPEWLKAMCYNRDAFKNCGLIIDSGTPAEQAFLFLYAKQQPLMAVFAPMRRRMVALPPVRLMRGDDMQAKVDAVWEHQFYVDFGRAVLGQQLSECTVDRAWVLRLLSFTKGRVVGSPADPDTYEDIVHDMPRPKRGGGDREEGEEGEYRTGRRKTAGARGVYEDNADEPMEHSPKKPRTEVVADEDRGGLEPDELAAMSKDLEAKRNYWQYEQEELPTHFEMTVRGGKWTSAKKGVSADVAAAWASHNDAGIWCKAVFGVQMASFSLKYYTETVAGHLAILWAKRMEFFYKHHLAGNFVDGKLPARLLEDVPSSDSVKAHLALLPDKHPGWTRLAVVESTTPPLLFGGEAASSGS